MHNYDDESVVGHQPGTNRRQQKKIQRKNCRQTMCLSYFSSSLPIHKREVKRFFSPLVPPPLFSIHRHRKTFHLRCVFAAAAVAREILSFRFLLCTIFRDQITRLRILLLFFRISQFRYWTNFCWVDRLSGCDITICDESQKKRSVAVAVVAGDADVCR